VRLLATRLLSLLPCILIIQFADIENANVVLNIIQFVQLPFVIIPAIRFISDARLVEDQAYLGVKLYCLLVVSAALIGMNLYQLISNFPDSVLGQVLCSIALFAYVMFLGYIGLCSLASVPPPERSVQAETAYKANSLAY
jgi:hypothetical protein